MECRTRARATGSHTFLELGGCLIHGMTPGAVEGPFLSPCRVHLLGPGLWLILGFRLVL